MKTNKYLYFVLCSFVLAFMSSCEPKALTEDDVLINDEAKLQKLLDEANPDGYKIYNINTLLAAPYMTENGNFKSDSSMYRTRSTYKVGSDTLQLFSIDTLPTNGKGIYLRGRIATDDYGGNFYKTLVIQQLNDWEADGNPAIDQQCLRISVDMGSASGMFHQGQEIIIRCNGLAIGRYANQPQLCIPTYNNNIYANKFTEKVGWAPGRIPAAKFRHAALMVGSPDKSKLTYETLSLAEFETKYLNKYNDVAGARLLDARLVKLTDVHFTSSYDTLDSKAASYKARERACNRYNPAENDTIGNPEEDKNACTFAPTTGNLGHPQSRYVKDAGDAHQVLISASEYSRYAHFYLPAAKYVGSITGVLSYYFDNGGYKPDQTKWAITPNNMDDILPECQKEDADPRWTPIEWKKGTAQPTE